MQKIRLFIALDLPMTNDQGQAIDFKPIYAALRSADIPMRPVHLHITLVFLGEVVIEKVKEIKEIIKKTIANAVAGKILANNGIANIHIQNSLQLLGSSAISLMIEPNNALEKFVLSLQENLHECGISWSQKGTFLPHITLARLNEDIQSPYEIKEKLSEISLPKETGLHTSFTAYQISLYKSLGQSNYDILEGFFIKG